LCAWELGGGLGHVQALLSVARALAREGHEPVCAFRNVVEGSGLWRDLPFPVLQSPVWHDRPFPGGSASFADILACHGYTDPDDLAAVVQAWQRLLDLVRPDLIVCDHSPTVCLTAWRRVPVIRLGTGFSVPPAGEPFFPVFDPSTTPLVPQERVLEVVRQVQRRRGGPVPDTLCEVWREAVPFIRTFAELDPYRAAHPREAFGPLEPLPPARPLPPVPRYFAYLAADFPGVQGVLDALAGAGLAGSVYLRGAGPAVREQLRRPGLTVHDRPVPVAEALAGASLLVHHGGIGTTEQALAVGRPQLVLPRHPEQVLTALAVNALGGAAFLSGRHPLEHLFPLLRWLEEDPRAAAAAQARARAVQERYAGGSLPALVELCRRCLAGPGPDRLQPRGPLARECRAARPVANASHF
jgi:UDP:flavonoid glycosyltransferase YjiC (YdhE family)